MKPLLESSNYSKIEEEKPLVNYKRVWYRILRYWYLVGLSLFIALCLSYIYNRYASKTYAVAASIIIKESEEAGQTAELLYNNPLVDAYRNFLNEPYIIKSYPLLQKVVDSLNLSVAIYKEGNIKTTELYKILPLKISGNKKLSKYLIGLYNFEIINSNEFVLTSRIEEGSDSLVSSEPKVYHGTL